MGADSSVGMVEEDTDKEPQMSHRVKSRLARGNPSHKWLRQPLQFLTSGLLKRYILPI